VGIEESDILLMFGLFYVYKDHIYNTIKLEKSDAE